MKVHNVKGSKPMSEKEMIKKFDVDGEKREAEKLKHNSRPTSMRRADGEIAQVLNYQTTLFLKRKYPEEYETIIEVMEERLKTLPPKFNREHYDSISGVLGQVLLADAHIDQQDTKRTSFGKRKKRIIDGTKGLLNKIDMFEPEQLLYCNMGDYFNTAGSYKTVRGTDQQNMMSEKDAWKFGIDLQAEILLLMSEYGPVDAKFIAGNHDGERLHHLQDVMKYYFSNNKNITIDSDKDVLQFYKWGRTMFGYDHGHEIKPKQLAERMTDNKKGKEHIEAYRGHLHHKTVEAISNVLIHNISNAGLQSEWEKNKGYAHNPSLTGLIHDKYGKVAELREKL